MGEDPLAELRDHIYAIQQLLLSHVAASEHPEATIEIAKTQSDAALAQGRNGVAIRLDAMIDQLRRVCELPAND